MNPKTALPLPLLFIFVGSTLLPAPAPTAPPRDELLRLVPDDVGFCLVLQDLRSHLKVLDESPFVVAFRASPLGKAIAASPELTQLAEAEKHLKAALGTDLAQLRDELLGDAVVLAYRPPEPGKPEREQGLLLLRARDAAVLVGLVDRLNKAQEKGGDLKKLEQRTHNNVTYYLRVESKQQPYFYCLRGPVLVVSGQEEMLRRAIDLDLQAPAADAQAPPLLRQLRQLSADKALLAVWINPRAFETDLQQKVEAARGAEAVSLKTFLSYWKSLEGMALTLTPRQDLEFGLTVRVKEQGLSAAAHKFLGEAARRSELWNAFPENALLAVAGRMDVPSMMEFVGEFLGDDARKALRDSLEHRAGPAAKVVRDLLLAVGPDYGFCVMAPPPDDRAWAPQMFSAVRVRPGPDGKPIEQTLWGALNFFAGLAVLDWNGKHEDKLDLKTVLQDKTEVKYFLNDKQFPPGVQPAFALKDGYLVLASSPEVVGRFKVTAAQEPEPGTEVPLFRMSLQTLRGYLKDRREPLIVSTAARDNISNDEAARRLDNLQLGLQFVDVIELTHQASAGQVVFTFRVRGSQPLRK